MPRDRPTNNGKLNIVEFRSNRGGGLNPNRDPILLPLGLSREESADLLAFLKAL